jgi:hypothetical protein
VSVCLCVCVSVCVSDQRCAPSAGADDVAASGHDGDVDPATVNVRSQVSVRGLKSLGRSGSGKLELPDLRRTTLARNMRPFGSTAVGSLPDIHEATEDEDEDVSSGNIRRGSWSPSIDFSSVLSPASSLRKRSGSGNGPALVSRLGSVAGSGDARVNIAGVSRHRNSVDVDSASELERKSAQADGDSNDDDEDSTLKQLNDLKSKSARTRPEPSVIRCYRMTATYRYDFQTPYREVRVKLLARHC